MAYVRTQVTLFINRSLSPQAMSARLVALAKTRRDELIRTGKASPEYDTYVDRAKATAEDGAKREITYQFNYMGEAAQFALDFLRARAPTGKLAANQGQTYRDSFMVSVNGRDVRWSSFDLTKVPRDATIIIYNRQPFSRKADVQYIGTKKMKFDVPAGMFADAARNTNRRFGNSTRAYRVNNVDFVGKYTTRKIQLRKNGRVSRAIGSKVESPALVISPAG